MKKLIILLLVLMAFSGDCAQRAMGEGLPFVKEGLKPILTRPDMVVLVPNGGVVFVYRDKYGNIVEEEYYSIRVHDQGVGLCDDVGNKDVWLFTGGGMLLHREEDLPNGVKPYWRYKNQDQTFLHNEKSTIPRK